MMIRLLDTRVGARMRNPRPTDIVVGSATPFTAIFGRIKMAAGGFGRIEKLTIIGHGIERPYNSDSANLQSNAVGRSDFLGGYGVQLGLENLTSSTVRRFSVLRQYFRPRATIDVLACAIANSNPLLGFDGNGIRLLQELAAFTGANVFASDAVQWFSDHHTTDLLVTRIEQYDGVRFDSWAGNVYMFSPAGRVTRLKGS